MVRSGLLHGIPGLALLVIGIVLSLVASTVLFAAGLALVGVGDRRLGVLLRGRAKRGQGACTGATLAALRAALFAF